VADRAQTDIRAVVNAIFYLMPNGVFFLGIIQLGDRVPLFLGVEELRCVELSATSPL
jgi:hypothetical protein